MDSNRIVVIGEADSFWTKRYIEYVLLPLGKEVLLITPKSKQYDEFYKENRIRVLSTYGSSILFRIPKVNTLCARIKMLLLINNYRNDTIVVQYAFPSILNALKWAKTSRLIITYWGSDLYRVEKARLKSVTSTVNRAESIIVMTEDMRKSFREQYPDVEIDKIHVIDMGVSAFEEIEKRLSKISEVKKKVLSEYSDRVSITIGYNADPKQQHDKVLKEVSELPQRIKDRIVILLPMTYRATDKRYLEDVSNQLKTIGVPSIVFTDFMDDEQISEVCVATDIFINAQTTDALSSSMLEQLFSGSKMYSGAWLKYSFLDELGVEYYSFNDFSELGQLIENDVDTRKTLCDYQNLSNSNLLKNQCSWETTRTKWEKLL